MNIILENESRIDFITVKQYTKKDYNQSVSYNYINRALPEENDEELSGQLPSCEPMIFHNAYMMITVSELCDQVSPLAIHHRTHWQSLTNE